jgi:hypothetical protein
MANGWQPAAGMEPRESGMPGPAFQRRLRCGIWVQSPACNLLRQKESICCSRRAMMARSASGNSASRRKQGRWLLVFSYGKAALLVDGKTNTFMPLDFSNIDTFSPDDRWLLNAQIGQVILWDLSKRRATELPAMGTPKCAVFSPRGDRLLIGYQQNMARLWNPARKLPLFGPLTHATAV